MHGEDGAKDVDDLAGASVLTSPDPAPNLSPDMENAPKPSPDLRAVAAPLARLDAALGRFVALAGWLALPVSLLLFLQWPLRELVGAWSREANDLGQICFALYMACAITAATRAKAHLTFDAPARLHGERRRRALARAAILLGVFPWTLFVLFTARGLVWNSLLQLERFADTLDPGYFLVRAAVALLALLMLAQGVLDLAATGRGSREPT